jgi:hypothetical protein
MPTLSLLFQSAALTLMLACEPAPVPLPDAVGAPGEARRVRVPGVDGYLARPSGEGEQLPSSLLLVDDLGPETQATARQLAEAGAVVLAVGPESDEARARAYLDGMSDTTTPSTVCQAQRCR